MDEPPRTTDLTGPADPGSGGGAPGDEVIVRTLRREEFDTWQRTAIEAFGERVVEEARDRFRERVDPERCLVGMAGSALVATAVNFPMRLTLPGGRRAGCAGVSLVTVAPTHRRRGVLRRLMTGLLQDAGAHGEPFAALYASEGGIYGRFGFAPAADGVDLRLREGARQLADEPHRPAFGVRLLDRDEARSVVPAVFDRAVAKRPGALDRPDVLWSGLAAGGRGGPPRIAALGAPGHERGYVQYRARPDWREGSPALADGTVTVEALVGEDAAAELELWRFVFGIDLVRTVIADARPADDAVLAAVRDPLAATVRRGQPLWLRLLDLPAALTARSYAADGEVVIDVHDTVLPDNAGRWRLSVRDGVATCSRTGADADVELDVAELAEVFLGRTRIRTLEAVGRVRAPTPGAPAVLDAIFRVHPAPWNPLHF